MRTPAEGGIYVGYARVSTEEQHLDLQIDALVKAGVQRDHIYSEKLSGLALKRPMRDAAVRDLRQGDVFVVWKLDRVGRSLIDLLTFMQRLEDKRVGFLSLQDGVDTTTPMGKLMIGLLGTITQFERDLISQRTRAGVAAAKAKGTPFGRKPKVTPAVLEKIRSMVRVRVPVKEIAARLKLSEPTIRRWLRFSDLERLRASPKPRKRKT